MSRENHIYEPDWSGRTDQLCSVNKPVIKKDALALVTGKPVYVDDLAPKDCLIVKVLRSPHANAIVKSVKKTAAERVPGIEAIYTWEDVPKQRFTMAGQTYPEPSPYDRLILDQHVRYVGDPVAIIAGQGAEQCGFCNPGMIMNAIALFRENPDPSEEEIKEYLAGNLCRCSGYEGQLRGILNFLAWKKQQGGAS